VNTAWSRLDGEGRQLISDLLAHEAFGQLDAREQRTLVTLLGGTNTQLSVPARAALTNRLRYMGPDAATSLDDKVKTLRSFISNPGRDAVGRAGERAGVPRQVPVDLAHYDSRRLERSTEPPVSDRTRTTEHTVTVDGQPYTVTIPPRNEAALKGRFLPGIEEIAKAIAALPPWARAALTHIEVRAAPSERNEQHRRASGNPEHQSFMEADMNGRVTIFPVPQNPRLPFEQQHVDGSLVHELAHTISKQKWDGGAKFKSGRDNPAWDGWRNAIQNDAIIPSNYARDSVEEDFSEYVKLYEQVRGTPQEKELREMMPERYRLLDQHFPEVTRRP
jgi:hypothetical protein